MEVVGKKIIQSDVITTISVFNYIDFKLYLKDYYHWKKATDPSFSFARFALKAKLPASNYLKRAMDGNRPLSSDTIPKFAMGLQLSGNESLYFESLVYFNQAKDEDVKRHYWSQLRAAASSAPGSIMEILGPQEEALKHWYILPVRELVTLHGFKEDPSYISKKLKGKITKKEAEHALNVLLELKMLSRDESGKLIQSNPIVRYAQEVLNLTVRDFHRQMLGRTGDALETDQFGTWNVRALSLAIKKEQFQGLYQRISNFVHDVNKEYSFEMKTAADERDMVVQFNCQLVQVTETTEPVIYQKPNLENKNKSKEIL